MPQLQSIYEGLAAKNPQIKELGFEGFSEQMKDDNNLRSVYDGLAGKNPQLKEIGFDSFKSDMFGEPSTRGSIEQEWGKGATNTQDPTFGETTGAHLKKGLADFYSWIADVPKTLYRTAAIPQNIIAHNVPGMEWLEATPEGFSQKTGITNPVSGFYNKQSDLNQSIIDRDPDTRKGIIDAFSKGEYKAGFKNLSGSIIESAPSTIAAMLRGWAGYKPLRKHRPPENCGLI
jgi:hypothetical protein